MGFNVAFANISYALCKFDVTDVDVALLSRTEKNACQWSDDKLRELLKGLVIENDDASCEITDIEKLEGEAVVNNRKGKLIFFYEWDIILKWKGSMNDSDEDVEGKINIPNLSEENKDLEEKKIIKF